MFAFKSSAFKNPLHYVEKPAWNKIWKGWKIVEAARKYHRVVQVCAQNRSSSYGKSGYKLIQSRKLGDLHLVRVFNLVACPAGAGWPCTRRYGWDTWLGPAPHRGYRETWFRDQLYFGAFSGGLIEEDAIRQLDWIERLL